MDDKGLYIPVSCTRSTGQGGGKEGGREGGKEHVPSVFISRCWTWPTMSSKLR